MTLPRGTPAACPLCIRRHSLLYNSLAPQEGAVSPTPKYGPQSQAMQSAKTPPTPYTLCNCLTYILNVWQISDSWVLLRHGVTEVGPAAYLAALQILAASNPSVALRWLKDGQGVISQEIRQHKLALPASYASPSSIVSQSCHVVRHARVKMWQPIACHVHHSS